MKMQELVIITNDMANFNGRLHNIILNDNLQIVNEKLKEVNYNLGFVGIEVENNIEYITELYREKMNFVVNLDNNIYCANNKNPYCAFWIYNNDEFIFSK